MYIYCGIGKIWTHGFVCLVVFILAFLLTHWGRATHIYVGKLTTIGSDNGLSPGDAIWWNRSWSTFAQLMACCLTAPNHYPNQCWLTINEILWHSFQGNVYLNAQSINKLCLKFTHLKSHASLSGDNELTHESYFRYLIFHIISVIDGWGISYEVALRWI